MDTTKNYVATEKGISRANSFFNKVKGWYEQHVTLDAMRTFTWSEEGLSAPAPISATVLGIIVQSGSRGIKPPELWTFGSEYDISDVQVGIDSIEKAYNELLGAGYIKVADGEYTPHSQDFPQIKHMVYMRDGTNKAEAGSAAELAEKYPDAIDIVEY